MDNNTNTSTPAVQATVYHDGECPLCNKEVAMMQKIDVKKAIKWVDISKNKQALADAGISYQQAMELTGWMSIPGRSPYQVIAGGLNDVPDSRTVVRMKQRYASAWESVHGFEPVATWPTALGGAVPSWTGCLDYLLATSNLNVAEAKMFGNKIHPEDETLFMSDHIGIIASFSLDKVG